MAERERRRSGCWWLFVLGSLIPLVGILLLVIGFFVRERSARQQLNQRIAQRAEANLPFDDASMTIYHHRLTETKNTDEWLQVIEEIGSNDYQTASQLVASYASSTVDAMIDPKVSWESEQVTREFLAQHKQLHGRVQSLSLDQLQPDAKPVRFPVEFNSFLTPLPIQQKMREPVRLLVLHAKVAIRDRDSNAVRRDIEAIMGCAQALEGDPILISQLISVAGKSMGLEVLRLALEQDMLSEQDLVKLQTLVQSNTTVPPQWRYAMEGETGLALPAFNNPSLADASLNYLPGRTTDSLHFLDHMSAVIACEDSDLDTFLAKSKLEEERIQELASGTMTRIDAMLTILVAPSAAATVAAFVRQAIMHRMATIAIGVRIYEKRNGKLPASLDELSSVGIDASELKPIGKNPFGYQIDENGAVLWGLDPSQSKEVSLTPPQPSSDADNQIFYLWTLPIRND